MIKCVTALIGGVWPADLASTNKRYRSSALPLINYFFLDYIFEHKEPVTFCSARGDYLETSTTDIATTMTLRLCILVSLVAMAAAQSGMGGLMDGFTANLSAQYANDEGTSIRNRHFYCLGAGKTITDFPKDVTSANGTPLYYLWSIFVQYPVLSYLDSQRKENLFNIIADLTQRGGNADLANFNESDFCVGRVTNYQVANYRESVLINFYFQGSTVMSVENPNNPVTIERFNTAFITGYNSQKSENNLIKEFQGRYALAIDSVMPLNGLTEENFHPRATLPNDQDPTLRAVFLGSYVGGVTIDAARRNQIQEFASNPNPINFNLEAGDIIFAIFGGIFLTITLGLVVLGFCIHPFFLA